MGEMITTGWEALIYIAPSAGLLGSSVASHIIQKANVVLSSSRQILENNWQALLTQCSLEEASKIVRSEIKRSPVPCFCCSTALALLLQARSDSGQPALWLNHGVFYHCLMMLKLILSADDPSLLTSFTTQRVQLTLKWLGAEYGMQPINCLVMAPRAGSYSLRNRIIPRFLFLRHLHKQLPGTRHGCCVHQSSKVAPVDLPSNGHASC